MKAKTIPVFIFSSFLKFPDFIFFKFLTGLFHMPIFFRQTVKNTPTHICFLQNVYKIEMCYSMYMMDVIMNYKNPKYL
ncbi:hypothetical protein MsAm2_03840 [Methanolapillus ohkumae]|uniref:Uncharacterized protein n=1 Tax=Methanolapillus ohkumae TaxID=3028298 RepID=A0AA96VHH1_9EURY|nr:hypothetical protein MsAm2_03840 [Methanosarcinaceae archaeon Am2]